MFKTIQPIPTTRWQSGPESPTALDQVMLQRVQSRTQGDRLLIQDGRPGVAGRAR